MTEPICLTEEEVAALRQVLSMLAVIGDRGYRNEKMVCEISWQLWYHELLRPAQALMRIAPDHRLATR